MADLLGNLLASLIEATYRNCNLFEICTLAVILAIAISTKARSPILRSIEKVVVQKYWNYLGLFLAVAGVRSLILFLGSYPVPQVADEFSHLFLAETLAAGRFSNPSHLHWQFFETIHILAEPTRSSMYLFGPALWLAAGKLLLGHPFWGVVLAGGIAGPVIFWAIQPVLEPRWAWLGALLITMKAGMGGIFGGYWLQSYWGGFPGGIAGALALGACFRLYRGQNPVRNGLLLGLGAGLLANTRPFEGLVLCMALAFTPLLLPSYRPGILNTMRHAALPAAAVLTVFGILMAAHFKSVTGSATTMPYAANLKAYGWPATPLPFFASNELPALRHANMAAYRRWELGQRGELRTLPGFVNELVRKLSMNWQHYLGPLLLLPFVVGLWRGRLPGELWIPLAFLAAALAFEQTGYPHYVSPGTALLAVVVGAGCRQLSERLPGFVRLLPPAALVVALVHALAPAITGPDRVQTPCCRYDLGRQRHNVEQTLAAASGKHLVFVPQKDSLEIVGWVYNPPDIDQAKVVFANDMGAEENVKLIRYFGDRSVWTAGPAQDLQPYSGTR